MEAYCYIFAILTTLVCVSWIYYLVTGNPSVIDGFWSIGIMAAGLVYIILSPYTFNPIQLCSAFLITAWAVRLSVYMFKARISKQHIDKRYLEFSKKWKMNPKIGFMLNFILQGFLMYLVSSSFYFIANRAPESINLFDYSLLAIATLSFALEALADLQLSHFKKNSQGLVCNVGLWGISRHPNYFFDFVFWLAFALMALPASYGFIGMISPITMLWIFLYISIPLTEKLSLENRGDAYRAYQKDVARFLPFLF